MNIWTEVNNTFKKNIFKKTTYLAEQKYIY